MGNNQYSDGMNIKYEVVGKVDEKQPYPIINFCTAVCLSFLGICALFIARHYEPETSPCGNSDIEYIIDLPWFLYVVGGIGILISVLILFVTTIMVCASDQESREGA